MDANAFTMILVGKVEAIPASEALPTEGWLARVELDVADIADCSSATMYLAHDADGESFIAPNATSAAVQSFSEVAAGGGTLGGVVQNLDRQPWRQLDGLYVGVKLDAGTATVTVRIWGETNTPFRG